VKVGELMSAPAVVVRPATSIAQLAEILREREISAVPVVDADLRLLGLVSEGDLLPLELADGRSQESAGRVPARSPANAAAIMTKDVIWFEPTLDAGEAAHLMSARGLRHVPVVEDGRVVGMLSRRDLIGMMARTDEQIQAEVEELLSVELGRGAPRVHVHGGELHVELAGEAPLFQLVEVLATSVPGVRAVAPQP
jgi:CBS domain-containing protein